MVRSSGRKFRVDVCIAFVWEKGKEKKGNP